MNKSLVIDMGVKLITRAAVLIAIFSLATGDALIYPQCTARAGAKKETIVVELNVEGFMDLAKRELIFEAGSNGGGGGGVALDLCTRTSALGRGPKPPPPPQVGLYCPLAPGVRNMLDRSSLNGINRHRLLSGE